MLKPIEPVDCSGALRACQNMMREFALWLCQPTTRAAQLTAVDLQALPLSPEESRWLWGFLNKKLNRHKLLERAAHLAELVLASGGRNGDGGVARHKPLHVGHHPEY
mgnify:CR=1 FL=1